MENNKITQLVTKAQSGDKNALNMLMNDIYNDLYYYVLKTVKDSELAADITQESCIEIITSINKLQSPQAFGVWSKRIAFCQCTRYFRKTKEVLAEENEDGETVFDTLADHREDALPQQVLEDKEFRKTIMDIINSLPPEQSNALLLYYYEKLSVAQIAEIQGTTEGTVKSRLNYGRKAIKCKVEDYEEKTGTKLHGVALLPLLIRFAFGTEKSAIPAVSFPAAVTSATGVSVAGATAAVAAKTAGISLSAKVIAGVVAAAVALGGAVFGFSKLSGGGTESENHANGSVNSTLLPENSQAGDISAPENSQTEDNSQTESANPDENAFIFAGEWVPMLNVKDLSANEKKVSISNDGVLNSNYEDYLPNTTEITLDKNNSVKLRFTSKFGNSKTYYFCLQDDGKYVMHDGYVFFYRQGDYDLVELTPANITDYIEVVNTHSVTTAAGGMKALQVSGKHRFKEGLGVLSFAVGDFIYKTTHTAVTCNKETYEYTIGDVIGYGTAAKTDVEICEFPTISAFFGVNNVSDIVIFPYGTKDPAVEIDFFELTGAEKVFGKVLVPKDWNK